MRNKVSKLLRKFAQETDAPLKMVKKEYNNLPKNKRFIYKQNIKNLI